MPMNLDYELLDKQIRTLSKIFYILKTKEPIPLENEVNEEDMENFDGVMDFLCDLWEKRPKGICPDEDEKSST